MTKVIVQDSDEGNLEVLSLALESQGYIIQGLARSKYILDQIKWFDPEIIILNFLLSGEDSIAACKQIKENYPSIPVMATSCIPDIDYRKYGFDGFLAKPFQINDLYANVSKCLKRPL